ncbi:MAG TPA: chloride channel protein [Candidatus Kapabacteria bacterium]|nr:chloride channel protein [Candidatus Kapabacteria bacterium]
MIEGEVERSSTTNGLPVAPGMEMALAGIDVPREQAIFDRRSIVLTAGCMALAIAAVFIAQGLQALIAFFTNLFFYGHFSLAITSPADNQLGLGVLIIPVIGGLIVGVMARFGSSAIRGHGIPEAMEQVLLNESRIHPWMTFLKPISSAIAIGSGGPFGAEGPIIATGGALGSVIGQLLPITANERKILLTAGAAAGMTAIFGTPVAAILLSIELLLFEFKARSIIPIALASVTAATIRYALIGNKVIFAMPNLTEPGALALTIYLAIGVVVGVCSVYVSKLVYLVEDLFEKLPIHWMWWPAIGAVAVGICGYFVPRTLGVGYNNITDILTHSLATQTVLILCLVKFISWAISLGSGTSGGTMAPLFTIGSGLGMLFGVIALWLFPNVGVDLRMAALVGMAALFAGATRALLTSVVLAFETTLQPISLLPVIGGCSAAYVVSSIMMKNTIMTEKIARRGVRVPSEYQADFLDRILVRDLDLAAPITLDASRTLESVREWIATGTPGSEHQGFPVLENGNLIGVITRRDIISPRMSGEASLKDIISRAPICVYDDCTLRESADHMVSHNVGRLPVISRTTPPKLIGIITRSDLLAAHRQRLEEHYKEHQTLRFKQVWSPKKEET